MIKPTLFIFDWDGTILDSADRIVSCMNKASSDAGFKPLPVNTVKNIIGLGMVEAIRMLYPNIIDDDIDKIKESYIKHFLLQEHEPLPFFPGVLDTLAELKKRGHYLAVATGKSRRGLDRVLQNLGMADFFDGTRCADETASKPNPMMLNELLEQFAVDVSDALMIGDTEWDMVMAQSIAMPRVAVTYGAHEVERLKKFKPNICIDHFDKLLSYGV